MLLFLLVFKVFCCRIIVFEIRVNNIFSGPGTPSSFPGLFEPTYPDHVKQKHISSYSSATSQRYSQSKVFPRTQTSPQVVTRFGASPYSIPPISKSNLLKGSEQNGGRALLRRSNSFKCLQEAKRVFDDDISDSDSFEKESDIDSVSDFTSVSQCQNIEFIPKTVTVNRTAGKSRYKPV